MPGGRPAVSLPIFSCEVSSALRTAALKAAATRSSSMSLSSPTRLGSMATRLTSCLQVMVTLTRPAPDSPVTSIVASSSCAFFRLSCIACACFIRPASCPFIIARSPRDSQRLHGTGDDPRGLVLGQQRLDERIVLDHLLGLGLAASTHLGGALGRRVGGDAGLDLEPRLALQQLGDRAAQPLAKRRRAQVLALDTEYPAHRVAVALD